MSRIVELLRVFVASPSDVDEERLTLEKVVEELNRSLPDQYGVRLDLVRSETHTYPGLGPDAQDVINSEIGDNYDIFIGIMWTRFGTPTHRAGSGTEEEFNRAIARLEANHENIHVMMYFKDAPIEPSKIDHTQLSCVQEFKSRIESRGAYTWRFKDTPEFVQNARLHLTLYLRDRSLSTAKEASKVEEAAEPNDSRLADTSEEDLGLLDYLELFNDSMERLRTFASSASDLMTTFTARLQSRTKALAQFKQPGGAFNLKEGKKILNKASHDLEDFTTNLETERQNFSLGVKAAVEAFQGALQVSADFDAPSENEKKFLLEQIESLIKALEFASDGIASFRGSIGSAPRATIEFNRAKKDAGRILDAMVEEFQKAINLFSQLIDPIQRL